MYGLIYKLQTLNVHPDLCCILEKSFANFVVNIKLGGILSKQFTVTQGVHQGGPLSSFLFQIYIDELLQILQDNRNGVKMYNKNISCVAYADDIALCSNTQAGLQELINIAVEYAKK